MKPKNFLPGIAFFLMCPGVTNNFHGSMGTINSPKNNESLAWKPDIPAPQNHIFGIKAAKIVFNFTGGMDPGKETLYFDDYGNVAVVVIDRKSKLASNNKTMIWKNKQTIVIDHDKKVVSKSSFRNKDSEAPSIVSLSADTRKNIGYKKLPNETIAGKNCEVWYNERLDVKYWIWKNIDLKKTNHGLTKEAASVEEITNIPSSVMEIPAGYKQ